MMMIQSQEFASKSPN